MSAENEFEFVCKALEASTDLDRLQARGTVRIALRAAGLEPEKVTAEQMSAVLDKLMPKELAALGVADPEAACATVASSLNNESWAAPQVDSPESIFERIGGGS